jgi:hypothetical protein
MGGPGIARPFVEAAGSTHPSLIDQTHRMDALFGVTNIPQVVWIDEAGTIVRPAEAGSAMPIGRDAERMVERIGGMDARVRYVAKLRDWVAKGVQSEHVLSPAEVVARSRPRPMTVSQAAAHFELAQDLWRREGLTGRTIAHFNAAHELQPDNITYKRQAYSALGVERSGDPDRGRFYQAPREGEDWPFVSDFNQDMAKMREGRLGPS